MSYKYHETLFLQYDERLQNKEYRSEKEKEFLKEHALIHEQMAAEKLSDDILRNVGIMPIQDSLFPRFGDN